MTTHKERVSAVATESFRALVEEIKDIIYEVDVQGVIRYVNPAAEAVSGYKPSEMIGQRFVDFIMPEDVEIASDSFRMSLEGDSGANEYRALAKSGQVIWLNVSAKRILKDGRAVGIRGVLKDITDRKMVEQRLQESEERYRKLFDDAPFGLAVSTADSKILASNRAISEILGYSAEQALGVDPDEIFVDPADRELLRERVRTQGGVQDFELKFQKSSGEIIDVSVSISPFNLSGETVFLAAVVDITDRKQLEEELIKAQKLESLGILAGGIAHDFNNILTRLWGNIQMVMMSLEPDERNHKLLRDSELACQRAVGLTKQLLTFSRGGAPVKTATSIGDLIESTAEFSLRGSNVRCDCSIPDDLWMVNIDQGQIGQVIENIIINADQAMPEGGRIELSVCNMDLRSDPKAQGLPLEDGKYLKIAIEDNGTGIKEEHLSKIFDPFFTTKQKGSGLGLATCYSIVKRHGGLIRAASRMGEGSTFEIYLPASDEPAAAKALKQMALQRGQGLILVMDDEEQLHRVMGRILGLLGYEVAFAFDGAEALEKYAGAKDSDRPFSAVILDLTIPGGMGGKETMRRLLEMDANVRGIVTSGYSNDPVLADYPEYGFKGRIVKPFKIADIGEELHRVLTG